MLSFSRCFTMFISPLPRLSHCDQGVQLRGSRTKGRHVLPTDAHGVQPFAGIAIYQRQKPHRKTISNSLINRTQSQENVTREHFEGYEGI